MCACGYVRAHHIKRKKRIAKKIGGGHFACACSDGVYLCVCGACASAQMRARVCVCDGVCVYIYMCMRVCTYMRVRVFFPREIWGRGKRTGWPLPRDYGLTADVCDWVFADVYYSFSY